MTFIRYVRDQHEYLIFIKPSGDVSACYRLRLGSSVGTEIRFGELPYTIQQDLERDLDPHAF